MLDSFSFSDFSMFLRLPFLILSAFQASAAPGSWLLAPRSLLATFPASSAGFSVYGRTAEKGRRRSAVGFILLPPEVKPLGREPGYWGCLLAPQSRLFGKGKADDQGR